MDDDVCSVDAEPVIDEIRIADVFRQVVGALSQIP
jgi:hypothetical protein